MVKEYLLTVHFVLQGRILLPCRALMKIFLRKLQKLIKEIGMTWWKNLSRLEKQQKQCLLHLTMNNWTQSGIASENSIYVLGIGYIVDGHVNHHMQDH